MPNVLPVAVALLLCLPRPALPQDGPDENPAPDRQEITIGQSVSGELDPSSDIRWAQNGPYFDSYTFDGEQDQEVTLTVRSGEFDPYIMVMGHLREGAYMQEDDDGGEGTDARLDLTLPGKGFYVIIVRAHGRDATGAYTLSLERTGDSQPVS